MRDHAPEDREAARPQRHFAPVEPIGHLAFQHEIELNLAVHVRARHALHLKIGAGAKAVVAENDEGMVGVDVGMGRDTLVP